MTVTYFSVNIFISFVNTENPVYPHTGIPEMYLPESVDCCPLKHRLTTRLDCVAVLHGRVCLKHTQIQFSVLGNILFKNKIYCWTEIIHKRCHCMGFFMKKILKFHRKYPDSTELSRTTIYNIVTKLFSMRSVLGKNKTHIIHVLTWERTDESGTRLEASPKKLLKLYFFSGCWQKVQFSLVQNC
jgi:hypothetical protein